MKITFFVTVSLAFGAFCSISCSSGSSSSGAGDGANLPTITPPVKAATPTGLKAGLSLMAKIEAERTVHPFALSASDIKQRFFSTTGPTQVLSFVLPNLDTLINSVNQMSATDNSACLTQTPVAYTITPFGQTVTMYGQCYYQGTASYTGDPSLMQFGINNGTIYIYSANGAEWIAAIVTPNTGASGQYTVKAWTGLGYSNTYAMPGQQACSSTWDGCSYGAMELFANTSTNTFEFAVAGMGFGYCGAQLKSDGTSIYALGSVDMGSTCNAQDSLCVLASDATTATTCSGAITTFALTPIGRQTVASQSAMLNGSPWAASGYPATPNLLFNGTSSDAIRFGPTTPTAGLGNITAHQ